MTHGKPTEALRLAAAVVAQALRDAVKGNSEALEWLSETSYGRTFWFRLLDLPEPGPDFVQVARRLINGSRPYRKTASTPTRPTVPACGPPARLPAAAAGRGGGT